MKTKSPPLYITRPQASKVYDHVPDGYILTYAGYDYYRCGACFHMVREDCVNLHAQGIVASVDNPPFEVSEGYLEDLIAEEGTEYWEDKEEEPEDFDE